MDIFESVLGGARSQLRQAAVHAAIELGLPDASAEPRSARELAEKLGAVPHKLDALLDVLVLEGLLQRDGVVGESTVQWTGRPEAIAPSPRQGWGQLVGAIRGQPGVIEAGEGPGDRRYQAHLFERGREPAHELAARWLKPAGRRLLDAGGGMGAYTRAFLEADAGAEATLVDRREVVGWAGEALADYGGRVTFRIADLTEIDLEDAYPVALLANVLHLYGPFTCERMVRRLAGCLSPGGRLVIEDLALALDRSGPALALYFALNMALYTARGRVHTRDDVVHWMHSAGLVEIETHGLASAPNAVVWVGRRGE